MASSHPQHDFIPQRLRANTAKWQHGAITPDACPTWTPTMHTSERTSSVKDNAQIPMSTSRQDTGAITPANDADNGEHAWHMQLVEAAISANAESPPLFAPPPPAIIVTQPPTASQPASSVYQSQVAMPAKQEVSGPQTVGRHYDTRMASRRAHDFPRNVVDPMLATVLTPNGPPKWTKDRIYLRPDLFSDNGVVLSLHPMIGLPFGGTIEVAHIYKKDGFEEPVEAWRKEH